MTGFQKFEDIDAWRMARVLAREIYEMSGEGAFCRDFALRDQMRRAAVSVVSNIAEGFERKGNAEFVQFLSIAKGSAAELRAQLYIALDCGYIGNEKFTEIYALTGDVSAKLGGLISYLRHAGNK